jgi:hypothetical protein
MTSTYGTHPNPQSPAVAEDVPSHVKYTISPDTETLVRLKTLPDAVCRVRFDDDGTDPFTVVSSSAGYLDLYATRTEEKESLRVVVEATNTSSTLEQALDLRCATSPTHDAPHHVPDPWPSSPLDRILPALSDEEATDEDATKLAARGYPKRPDPESSPTNYADWRRLVSRPLTVVAPSLVANPDYVRQPRVTAEHREPHVVTPEDVTADNSYNWAGGELHFTEGDTFVLVEGWWITPAVGLAFLPAGMGITSIWVGLNHPNAPQLLQCGVDHNAIAYPPNNLVTSYQAWSEMLPAQPFSVNINNLPIAPGDQMLCTSAVVNNANAPSTQATKTQNHVVNVTRQMIGQAAPPLDPVISNGAANAVWIVERPTFSDGSYPLLAQFPEIKFTTAAAEPGRQSLPIMPCYTPSTPGATVQWDFMYNTSNTLLAMGVEPGPSSPYEIDVFWNALA